MVNSPPSSIPPDPYTDQGPQCCAFPADDQFRTRLLELLGDKIQLRDTDPQAPQQPVLVDCLNSIDALALARALHRDRPLVSVLPGHDAQMIVGALAQGAAGVVALTDTPDVWVECLRVVTGGGCWLGGPGLEVRLEDKHASYDVARRHNLRGDITSRTRMFVKQRVADKFRS